MSIQSAWQQALDFADVLPIVVEPSDEQLSSDAGLLPLRQFDERIGLTQQFAAALDDPRRPALIRHELAAMTRVRIDGILADYEDQNDHDTLRHDPVFKLIAGRSPTDPDLASQPTLSRFENSISRVVVQFDKGFKPLVGVSEANCTTTASVVVSTRRILVRLAASWPHLDYFRQVSAHVQARPAGPHLGFG